MGYVKRNATTKASISDVDFEARKEQYLFDIHTIIDMEEIPKELVINWEHTGIHYIPATNWIMAPEGSKRIELAALDDKKQFIAVFAAILSGKFLPTQVICARKHNVAFQPSSFPQIGVSHSLKTIGQMRKQLKLI